MEQQITQLTRAGWREEERARLFDEIEAAARTGAPLRNVFEKTGEALGRKPNSVRNYYYMQMRPHCLGAPRATPFETFTEEETDALLRAVLLGKAEGRSVRASVMALANGDRTKMLRYQNKYRAILRKNPDRLRALCRELALAGIPAKDPTVSGAEPLKRVEGKLRAFGTDGERLCEALERVLENAAQPAPVLRDRMRVERDVAMLRLEDLKHAAGDMVLLCKEFVALTEDGRREELSAFCDELSHHISQVENAGDQLGSDDSAE